MPKEAKPNPTPYLGVPRSNEKTFTYSENRLLDQITTEIMEAWAKDLSKIRTHFKNIEKKSTLLQRFCDDVQNTLPELNEFLEKDEFKSLYKQFNERNEEINVRMGDINRRLINIENMLTRQSLPQGKEPEKKVPKDEDKAYSAIEGFFHRFSKKRT